MPRYIPYQIKWSEQNQRYEFLLDGLSGSWALTSEWLEQIPSFSFQSRSGSHYTARKETKQRGGTYWCGYRRMQERIIKRYIGKSSDLSLSLLEDIAHSFAKPSRPALLSSSAESQSFPKLERQTNRLRAPSRTTSRRASFPLLLSKLSPPRLSPQLVERSRLLTRLNEALSHPITLIQAPAGFGKTTAVLQWMNRRHRTATIAWVSLDTQDNDLHRFWRSIIAACQSLNESIGRAALAQLSAITRPPFEQISIEVILTHFINDLAQQKQGGLLILDDYHAITEPAIHKTLAFFCDHLPPCWQILLITRSTPPLPLLRWRTRGELAELSPSDLRFSAEETAAFLHQAGLPDEAIASLESTLNGWAVGLHLLALAQQGQPLPDKSPLPSLRDEMLPTQALLDYVVTEILQAQPEDLQLFLLQTSILRRFTTPLCNAVTGKEDGALLLGRLEREGLFLEALGDTGGQNQWYRYHPLFSEALWAEANRRLGEETLHALSLQASHWYEQHSLLPEAIEAALQAHDMERTVLLLEQAIQEDHLPDPRTLLRWLAQIPVPLLSAHPRICFSYATALQFSQELPPSEATETQVDTLLQLAENTWDDQDEHPSLGMVFAFRALRALTQGAVASAIVYAHQGLHFFSEHRPHDPGQGWHGVCLALAGIGSMQAGYFAEAKQWYQEAYTHALATENRPFARRMILLSGWCMLALGELHLAQAYFQQALSDAREQKQYEDAISALLGRARLSFEWNDLPTAEQQLEEAVSLTHHYTAGWNEQATITLALLQHARGQTRAAQQQLVALLAQLQATPSLATWQDPFDIHIWLTRLYLQTGDVPNAIHNMELLRRSEPAFSSSQRLEMEILQARLLLAENKVQDALACLACILPLVREQQLLYHLLEIHILSAQAYRKIKQPQKARHSLYTALSLAYQEGFIHLFLAEGEPLLRLIRALLPALREKAVKAYARTIVHASAAASKHNASSNMLVESLSPQEQRVLGLLAAGYTNPEIALELIVSVNTVKDHVKHIYQKLGVNNRLQASEIARRLHLNTH